MERKGTDREEKLACNWGGREKGGVSEGGRERRMRGENVLSRLVRIVGDRRTIKQPSRLQEERGESENISDM